MFDLAIAPDAERRGCAVHAFFDIFRSPDEPPLELQEEVWPTGLAPFIRRAEGCGRRRCNSVMKA